MKLKKWLSNYKYSLGKVSKILIHKYHLMRLEYKYFHKISFWNLCHDVDKIFLCLFYGYEEYVTLEMFHHKKSHHSKDLRKLSRKQLIEIVLDRESSQWKKDSMGLNCYDFTLLYKEEQLKYLEPIMGECEINHSNVGLSYSIDKDLGKLKLECANCRNIGNKWGGGYDDPHRPNIVITCSVCGNVHLSVMGDTTHSQNSWELGRDFDTTEYIVNGEICITE